MSRALICLVALEISSLGWAQPQPGQVPRDTSAATGSAGIHGRITDATGRPLARAQVTAGPNPGQVEGRIVLTDADGRYEIVNLPAGTYTIVATKANYVRTSWGEARPEGPGKRIPIADGQQLTNVDVRMAHTGVITGTIVDEFGDPVTDVGVQAMRYQYVQGARRLMPSGRGGSTNDIGEFRIYGLTPGQYVVSATLRNFVALNSDTTDRAGYAPTFYPGTGNPSDAQRLTVAPGQTITGINLSLLPIQTAKVSGTVIDVDGRPLADGMVMISPKSLVGSAGFMGSPIRTDGHFTISSLTPGDYTIRANATGTSDAAFVDVSVSGTDVSGVQITLARPSTIRGRIVFTPSADGSDPPKPTKYDLGAVREWALGQPLRSPSKIKDDGTFEISLMAGHVQLRAAPVGGGGVNGPPPWRINRVIYNDVDVGDAGIDVAPSATVENVVVEMTNKVSEITGHVTDADGKVVRDVYVIVFAQDQAKWTVQTRWLATARPALDDLFHARVLAGDYYAAAMSDVEANAWTDADFLSLAREHATKVSVGDNEKKTLDLVVVPAPVF